MVSSPSPYDLARRACKLAVETNKAHRIYYRRAALGDSWWIAPAPPRHGLWTEVATVSPEEAWCVETGSMGSLTLYLRLVGAVERTTA